MPTDRSHRAAQRGAVSTPRAAAQSRKSGNRNQYKKRHSLNRCGVFVLAFDAHRFGI